MAVLRILTFSFLLYGVVKAEFDNNLTDNSINKDNKFQTQLLKQEYPITWNSYTITATSVAVVVVVSGLIALGAFIWPLIAYKLCYLFGNCDQSLFTYIDQFMTSEMNTYKNPQKRSFDSVESILQALALGYEKYGTPELKKKSEVLSFYRN